LFFRRFAEKRKLKRFVSNKKGRQKKKRSYKPRFKWPLRDSNTNSANVEGGRELILMLRMIPLLVAWEALVEEETTLPQRRLIRNWK
jgi:hypothetical protein